MTGALELTRGVRMLVAVAVATAALVVGSSRPAEAVPSCLVVNCPAPVVDAVKAIPGVRAAADVVGSVAGAVGGAVGSAANAVLEAVGRGIAAAIGRVLTEVSQFLTDSSTPQVTVASFLGPDGAYHQVAQLAALLMVLFILFGVVQGVVAGDPVAMIGRTLRNVPLAVLAIFGFPWMVDQLVELVDAVCASLLPTGDTLGRIASVYVIDSMSGVPGILVQLFVFLGGVAIYAELVVRSALVTMVVALSPLSFAAMVWPAARGAARKVVELVLALVLSKLAIWVALSVGLGLFESHTQRIAGRAVPGGQSWGQMIAGAAILAVAVFAPFVVWRLIPVAEAAMVGHGLSRMPGRAAMGALTAGNMLRGRSGGGGGGKEGSEHPALADLPARSLEATGAPGTGGGTGQTAAAEANGSVGAGGRSAAAGAAAAPVTAAVQAGKAAKDKAVSSADSQSGAAQSTPSTDGWGFQSAGDGR